MEKTKQPRNPQRSHHFNFEEMNIPIGSKLTFDDPDKSIEVTIISERKVYYEGKRHYLLTLSRNLKNDPKLQHPCQYWKYDNVPLSYYFDKTYGPKPKKSRKNAII